MPRYLTFVKSDESRPAGDPPQELFEAIGVFAEKSMRDGTLIQTGGLLPSSQGALVTLSGGKIEVLDGPFAEAKELVGGYAMFELRNLDEAIEMSRQFLQLHVDHWPAFDAVVEVREVAESVPGDGS